MIWLAWILVALMCAVLFSVIRSLDRVTFTVQLLEARMDRITAGIDEIKVSIETTHVRLSQASPPAHAALGAVRSAVQGTTRSA